MSSNVEVISFKSPVTSSHTKNESLNKILNPKSLILKETINSVFNENNLMPIINSNLKKTSDNNSENSNKNKEDVEVVKDDKTKSNIENSKEEIIESKEEFQHNNINIVILPVIKEQLYKNKLSNTLSDSINSKSVSLLSKSAKFNLLVSTSKKNQLLNNYDTEQLIKSKTEKDSLEIKQEEQNKSKKFEERLNKFNDIHGKNLQIIQKLSDRLEKARQSSLSRSKKKDTSVARFDKIKKVFLKNSLEPIVSSPKSNNKLTNLKPLDKYYYYSILPGNNSEVVKKCMDRRLSWKETNNNIFNFRWQETSSGFDYSSLNKNSGCKIVKIFFIKLNFIDNKSLRTSQTNI